MTKREKAPTREHRDLSVAQVGRREQREGTKQRLAPQPTLSAMAYYARSLRAQATCAKEKAADHLLQLAASFEARAGLSREINQ